MMSTGILHKEMIIFIILVADFTAAGMGFKFPTDITFNVCTGNGVCLNYTKCRSVNVNMKIQPQICGWEGKEPMVCCPEIFERLKDRSGCATIPVTLLGLSRKKRDVFVSVVRGEDAKVGSWPWMAALFVKSDPERTKPFCGGSLISSDSVVTAAHCFLGSDESISYVVLLGDLKLGDASDQLTPLEVDVIRVKTHEGYAYPSVYNDIAILKLKTKVDFTSNIRMICLPDQDFNNVQMEGTNAVVTGWGHLAFGGSASKTLQEAPVPVIPNSQCNDIYKSKLGNMAENLPSGITMNIICAGDDKEKRDACQGDSGGPLVYKHVATNNWVLVGIVASGFECGTGIPGIYTRVSQYLPWIESNL